MIRTGQCRPSRSSRYLCHGRRRVIEENIKGARGVERILCRIFCLFCSNVQLSLFVCSIPNTCIERSSRDRRTRSVFSQTRERKRKYV
jgi:uncharacterized Fe-S radical SAM superfamily protein PflX